VFFVFCYLFVVPFGTSAGSVQRFAQCKCCSMFVV
jgi:hypothetical protein